jgi:hypothetical protein
VWWIQHKQKSHAGSVGDLWERDHLEDISVEGDNIKMDFQEVGWRCKDWIDMNQDIDR